jgi:hypothetical protein
LLVEDELLDFVADFDQYLSNKLDATVFAGELVDADHPLDYQAIKDEALLHEQQLEGHTNMLVDFVLELARARTDRRQAPEIVEDFVKKMMLAVAGDDYQLALDMFDQPTARGLQEVAIFRANNYEIAANLRFIEVEAQAPGGGYCGAGECGLEWVTDNNTDASKLKELGFNAKDSLRDTERKCKCGEKTVVYELKKAMKGCTSCGATTKY